MVAIAPLSTPFTLPSGFTFPNRLVKVALAEEFASGDDPNAKHSALYSQWARGGWGAIFTGNVQVDDRFLGSPRDVALANGQASKNTLKRWTQWAAECQSQGTPAFVQLNHPGRQSPRPARKENAVAPSAVPLDFGPGIVTNVIRSAAFGTPKEMTAADIGQVVSQFQHAAQLAYKAGFKGVELHAAHGYLLAQFMSPLINKRQDAWGGSVVKRAKIVRDIIDAIRQVVPKEFVVGIKINSADHQQEDGLKDSLEQVRFITEGGGVDFLEISGGTWENPRMMQMDWADANEGAKSQELETRGGELKATQHTAKREAFFLDYAHQVREKFPSLPLLVTGGFRSRSGMRSAIQSGACDLVGMGRPSTMVPKLPAQLMLNEEVSDEDAKVDLPRVQMPWYVKALRIKPLNAGFVTIHFQKELEKLVKSH